MKYDILQHTLIFIGRRISVHISGTNYRELPINKQRTIETYVVLALLVPGADALVYIIQENISSKRESVCSQQLHEKETTSETLTNEFSVPRK